MERYMRFVDRFCMAACILLVLVYAVFVMAGCAAEARRAGNSAASEAAASPSPAAADPSTASGHPPLTGEASATLSASTLEAHTYELPAASPSAAPAGAPSTAGGGKEEWGEAAQIVAKTVYGEAAICSITEQAAVIWCILNRVDSTEPYFPDDIISVALQSNQFQGYAEDNPVTPELYSLALDVFNRWEREKAGEQDVGRVLPAGYLYFEGDGLHNHFRTEWQGGTVWDWRLPSPYEEG